MTLFSAQSLILLNVTAWDVAATYCLQNHKNDKCFLAGISTRMEALQQAIQDYNDYTCIRLIPRTYEDNYVNFINGEGCYSYLGVTGGQQPISYGEGCDTTRGTPVHEIMHALGFMHEQQRPDRDQYVSINFENIIGGDEANFQKVPTQDTDLSVGGYDLGSVMHYPAWAFSSNGEDTITTLDSRMQDKIGQRRFFSWCDLAKINKFYQCPGFPHSC